MWHTSFATGKGKRNRKTIAHLSQTHKKKTMVAKCEALR